MDSNFIAEGVLLVERLLESVYPVHSLLISSRHAARLSHLHDAAPEVYLADEALLEQIVGFNFHRGVIACGERLPVSSLADLVKRDADKLGARYVVCPELNSPENLGAIFRTARAFGVDGVILGERCSDPFYRRCLRVSMGGVFHIPIYRSDELAGEMSMLARDFALEFVAAELVPDAQTLSSYNPVGRVGLVLGNEADGLSERFLDLCPRKVMIPMAVDEVSLNVGVAASICLYHLTQDPTRSSGSQG